MPFLESKKGLQEKSEANVLDSLQQFVPKEQSTLMFIYDENEMKWAHNMMSMMRFYIS